MIRIPLTQGKFALVDTEDYPKVAPFKWSASNESHGRRKWYAIRRITMNGKRYTVRMHRHIMGLAPGALDPSGSVVDHLNDDGLDNRRENLRVTTQTENMARVPRWKKRKAIEPCL